MSTEGRGSVDALPRADVEGEFTPTPIPTPPARDGVEVVEEEDGSTEGRAAGFGAT